MRRELLTLVVLALCGCGSGDDPAAIVPDGGAADQAEPGDGGAAVVALPAIDCPAAPAVTYDATGLPLLETDPGAPVALFLDYNGGVYQPSGANPRTFRGYSRDADFATFNAAERADIVASVAFVRRYFAMFDVNVTTIDAVRAATGKWGWILITEDVSGGLGVLGNRSIGTEPGAMSYAGASTVRSENYDKSRRLAHELGHNFLLQHSGVWDNGTFYKWEDWPQWDKVYGPIMGGGGYGQRVGWANGHHEGDPLTLQDDMEVIRQRIIKVGGRGDGWRKDDFAEATPAPLCKQGAARRRDGVLERPDDVDVFGLSWGGGDLRLTVEIPVGSSALVDIAVQQGAKRVAGPGTTALPAGSYLIRVQSKGGYAAIGEYGFKVE